jgi:ferric-dicitrate binding protein FerR (iron transport regulator)
MNAEELDQLLEKYLEGKCTPEETLLVEQLVDNYDNRSTAWEELDGKKQQVWLQQLWAEIKASMLTYETPYLKSFLLKLWPRIAAAAAILLVVGAGIWFYNNEVASSRKAHRNDVAFKNDIAPGKNTATITLPNGSIMQLSDAKTGVVVDPNSLKYNDGSLVKYSSGTHFSGSLKGDQKNTGPVGVHSLGVEGVHSLGTNEMLTAATPRGGTYQITLPDGTKVWLNAASSLKFPATFAGASQRVVSISGEAYFEVFRNKSQPFVVNSKKMDLTVLGTHFNVSAYEDESSTKATLLEGSVRVSPVSSLRGGTTGQASDVVLVPNQQAVVAGDNRITVKTVDANDAIDWKNGEFVFNSQSVIEILRKVGRWYDVEVIYEGQLNSSQTFSGKVSRTERISSVLKNLEIAGALKLRLDGRKVYVAAAR